jgi:hypothetical protein
MPANSRRAILVAFAAAALFVMPLDARAAQYPGWGDTGWVYASKRDCCDAAIAIAQEYSAQACINTGGVPRPLTGGGRRGSCSSEWIQDSEGGILWRCYGEASIWCR